MVLSNGTAHVQELFFGFWKSIVLRTMVLALSMIKETEKERKRGLKVLAKPNDD